MFRSLQARATAASILLSLGLAPGASRAQSTIAGAPPGEGAESGSEKTVPQSSEPPRQPSARTTVIGNVLGALLWEGILVGVSDLAANRPRQTGWWMVGIGPLLAVSTNHEETCYFSVPFGAGMAGLGLYDALELRGDRYSHSNRFWRNLIGWNVVSVASGITLSIAQKKPSPSSPRVAFAVDPQTGAPTLLVGGRF